MTKYKIAWLPGDGIGIDVMEAARIVLDKIKLDAEYVNGDVGWEFWKKEGNPLPDRTIKILQETDCCLFGAITSKPKEEADLELNPELKGKGYIYYSPIISLRQKLNLHTNFRPCKSIKGNPLNYRDDIDLVIFRENTEGLYSGIEYYPLPGELREVLIKYNPKMERFKDVPSNDIALSCRLITKKASDSIIRQGFEYAKKNKKKTVTIVEKANVLRETSGIMLREARKIAQEYPEIELQDTNIDAMLMWLIKNPQNYSVLVTTNLFGDILSDLSAQLVGGLGFGVSANIGDNYAVFEPIHGSAPKYAGLYKANPIAMLSAVVLMLEYLNENQLSKKLHNAIVEVVQEAKIKTYDLGGNASTLDVAKEIAKKI